MRLTFLILFTLTNLRAQIFPYFTHFTTDEGLSDNNVQCVLRDQQGYLWVGTAKGLNRFDGYHFKIYLPNSRYKQHSISNENIHDIGQDESGLIYIASANGLHVFDPQTEIFSVWKNTGRNNGSLPNSLVWSLYIESRNAIWLACDNRDLCLFDPRTETFKTYPWKDYLEQVLPEKRHLDYKTIFQILPLSERELLLVTNAGLFGFDKKKEQFSFYTAKPGDFPEMQETTCRHQSYMVMGNYLLRYEQCEKRWTQSRLPVNAALKQLPQKITRAWRHGGDYWVGTTEGMLLMDTATLIPQKILPTYGDLRNVPFGAIAEVYLDQDGLLWMGGEQGLWMHDPISSHFTNTFLTLPATPDQACTYHQFWDSPLDGRRYLLDRFGQQLHLSGETKFGKSLALPGEATLLFEDRDGLIWVGAGNRLFHFDRENQKLIPFDIPARLLDSKLPSFFTSMAQDADGNYWLGHDKAGLFVWFPHENRWWQPDEEANFISQSVRKIFVHRERQTIWIAASDYGLFRYDEKSQLFTLYQHDENDLENSLGAFMVNSICKDGLGFIWVATDPGGVSRFDYDASESSAFITLNMENGLPSNQVYSLLEDISGNIWVGTANGLAWIDCRSLRIRSFDEEYGLATNYLDLPLASMKEGHIALSAPSGYQSFIPDSILTERHDPKIIITSFKVFDREYSDSININFLKKITLPWNDDFFQIEFSSTNFAQVAKNEYAYRLIGFDKDWVNIKNQHSISYTNVPPGSYTLEIKSGRESHWNEVGVRLEINIIPPFWATWWFRSSLILLTISAIWGAYRWHIANIRREEKLKADFNQRLARTEMAALRAQMNPHFVFNCLSSINHFILINKQEEASDYLTRFSRLIRLILDNSRTETITLSKELETLRLYIEMEQMRFANRFDYQIAVADNIQAEHLDIPPLLIQPYVENAIWHGFMHKKSEGLLQINIYLQKDVLCIEIEDDGIGRKKAQELKSRSALTHKSHGMQLTTERLSMFQQLFGIKAMVETTDLSDANRNPTGTRVLIQIAL